MIEDALDYHIVDWRERMIDAIRAVSPPRVQNNNGARSAAWVGFGFDAVGTLYPEYARYRVSPSIPASLVSGLLKRVSVPVWALTQAQAAYAAYHEQQVNAAQGRLNRSYLDYRGDFIGQVQHICDHFSTGDYGRAATAALQRYFADKTYKDQSFAKEQARKIVIEAGLINKNPNELRQRVEAGFGAVARKVEMIYRDSPEAPAHRLLKGRLLYAGTDTLYWRRSIDGVGYQTYEFQTVKRQEDAEWLMAHAYKMRVWHDDREYTSMGGRKPPVTRVVCEYPNVRPRDLLVTFGDLERDIYHALPGLPAVL